MGSALVVSHENIIFDVGPMLAASNTAIDRLLHMTHRLTIAFLALLLHFTSGYSVADQGIQFKMNLEHAMMLSAESGKPIFLEGYASWCGPCKKMEAKVFNDAELANFFNQHFINVRIDMDRDARTRNRFGVKAYPTLLFLDKEGNILEKKVGYHNSQQLLRLGEKVLKKAE